MGSISGYDGDMENLITYTDVKTMPGGVYFVAKRRTEGHINTVGETIICPDVEINLGKQYNCISLWHHGILIFLEQETVMMVLQEFLQHP